MEDMWCLEGINKTWWSDGERERERTWFVGTLNCARLVGLASFLISTSPREAQLRTSPGVPVGPSCWLLRPGWLCQIVSLLLLTRLYQTGLLVYPWNVCEWIKLPLPANLCTELPISRQHRQELLQRTFLNKSTSPLPTPYPLFPTVSDGWWATREVKAFKNHH